MKIVFGICIMLLMLSVSCKKSNDLTNTDPVVTDTTKPPVIKVDTSTLLKTTWSYNYDASGTVVTDSALRQWKYDDHRRIIELMVKTDSYLDTFSYTYLNDRYILDRHAYSEGALYLISKAIFYQNLKGQIDSLVSTATGYGFQAGLSGISATYYYYNLAGQDSLEKNFQSSNGGTTYKTSINYYYTGQNLDSTISHGIDGKIRDICYYTDGNRIVDKWYVADAQQGVENIVYSKIPSKGLYVFVNSAWLVLETTSAPVGTPIEIHTYAYQYDSANRVVASSMIIGGKIFHKDMFTYY